MSSEHNTILKKKLKERNYTRIENSTLGDSRLSWKARGILAFMLSLPEDWEFNTQFFLNQAPDGKDSFNSGLEELEKFGYLFRTKEQRNEKGQFMKSEWTILEIPIEIQKSYPEREIRCGKSAAGNPPLQKKKEQITKSINDIKEVIDLNVMGGEEGLMTFQIKGKDYDFNDIELDQEELQAIEKFKFNPSQVLSLKLFKAHRVKSELKNITFWSWKYDFDRIKEVLEATEKYDVNNRGGYIRKLLEEEKIVVNDRITKNKNHLSAMIRANPWPSLEIFEKYAKYDLCGHEVEIDFNIHEDQFVRYINEKYQAFKDKD